MEPGSPIVVLYASAGGGHRAAARAIAQALSEGAWEVMKIAPLATLFAFMVGITLGLPAGYYGGRLDTFLSFLANLILAFPVILLFYLLVTPEIVETVDLLDHTPRWFARAYGDGYLWWVRTLPHLWDWAYELGEDLTRYRGDDPFTKWFRARLARSLYARLRALSPAAMVSTHFMCAAVVSDLKRRGDLDAWSGVVLTDYASHRIWMQPHTDLYCVPAEREYDEFADAVGMIGLRPAQVALTGIPIRKEFREPPDVEGLRERLDLREGVPCVVLMSGAKDSRILVRMLGELARVERPLDVLAIVGKERRRVHRAVERYRDHPTMRLQNLGIVDYISDVFAAADLVIGKAGGLTTTECLARQAPMLIFKPYKGQEERNAQTMLEAGAASRVSQFAGMARRIEHLVYNRERLARMKEACRRAARPDAALEVARRVVAGIRGTRPG